MKAIKYICTSLALIVIFSGKVIAACSITGSGSVTFPSQDIIVSASAPVGSVIGSATVYGSPINAGKCGFGAYSAIFALKSNYGYNSQYIANTSVSGVGVRIVQDINYPNPALVMNLNCPGFFGCAITTNGATMKIEFVKTGAITGGTISNMLIGTSGVQQGGTGGVYFSLNLGSHNVKLKSCSIINNVNIKLATVLVKDFSGPGSLAGSPASDNLQLNCPSSVTGNLTISGNTDAYDTRRVLALDSSSTAKGIGYAIKVRDVNVQINNNISLGTLSSGVNNIKFTADYIQTLSTITPGSANANANLNITYN